MQKFLINMNDLCFTSNGTFAIAYIWSQVWEELVALDNIVAPDDGIIFDTLIKDTNWNYDQIEGVEQCDIANVDDKYSFWWKSVLYNRKYTDENCLNEKLEDYAEEPDGELVESEHVPPVSTA